MYVIDITRDNFKTDMLCGRDSMDAKNKTINYIMDYAFANHNINLDRDVLDYQLNIELFSLKGFLKENYNIDIEDDLIIQGIHTDKKHCLFLKYIDENVDFPILYNFHKKDINVAQGVMKFLVNETLIERYQDDLKKCDELLMKDFDGIISTYYPHEKIHCDIVSLYNGGLFMEELLNNTCSLNQLQEKDIKYSF